MRISTAQYYGTQASDYQRNFNKAARLARGGAVVDPPPRQRVEPGGVEAAGVLVSVRRARGRADDV